MKAWRLYGWNDLRLDELPVPEAAPGWVLLRVRAVQPSITEVALYRGYATAGRSYLEERLLREGPLPVFGHEFCAEVAEARACRRRWREGERVAALAKYPCGSCPACRAGRSPFCRSKKIFGLHCPGALAEWTVAPETLLEKLPGPLKDQEGCCLQPLADALAAVQAARLRPADRVVIFGQGVMGLYCLQAARLAGVKGVLTVEPKERLRRLSQDLGADRVVDPMQEDPVQAVLEWTEGVGAEVVFETAGGTSQAGLAGLAAFRQATQLIRERGRIVPVALWEDPVSFSSEDLRARGVGLIFPPPPTLRTLRRAVGEVVSGRLRPGPLVRHVLHGIEKVPQAFAITGDKERYQAINPAQIHLA